MWNHSAGASQQLPSLLCPSTGWVEFCWPCTYTAWSIGSRAAQFRTCVLNSVSLSTYYKHRRETRRQASYRLGFVDFPIWQPTLDMVRDSYFWTWKLSNLKRPQLSILLVFEKFTRAHLFQIALEIMWLYKNSLSSNKILNVFVSGKLQCPNEILKNLLQ